MFYPCRGALIRRLTPNLPCFFGPGGVAEDVEIAFGGASGLGDMTASGGEIKGH